MSEPVLSIQAAQQKRPLTLKIPQSHGVDSPFQNLQ